MFSVFSSPNPILFGRKTAEQTGERIKKLGCVKVLVVYDTGIKKAGIADAILANIRAAGVETVIYDRVQPDPPDWSVEEAGMLGIREKVDGVVGLGGGSSIDTAKGAKLLLNNPPPIRQYFGREGVVTLPGKPLVVIPTTAGTGSECTPGGVITDTVRNIKTNIAGVGCAVSLGIVDPELTVMLPPAVTASTGMDAFCHAVESFTSNLANPVCEITAKEAIRLVGRHLISACNDGGNMEAREGMMLASTLGGISMLGPLCHLSHDIGRSLGAKFHIPHGNGCAACLPQVLEYISPAVPEKVRFVACALGEDVPEGASAAEIGQAACRAAKKLMKAVSLPNLRSFGLTKEQLLAVVPDEVVMQAKMLEKLFGEGTSPVSVTSDLIAAIISRAYDEN